MNFPQEDLNLEKKFLSKGFDALNQVREEVEEIDDLLTDLSLVAGKTSASKIKRIRDSLHSVEPSITMIGQIKSGKTTLVNAMIKRPELLPSDVNPWTSVVTSIHLNTSRSVGEPNATFQLFEKDEWDHLVERGGRIGELASRAGAEDELSKVQAQVAEMREKTKERLGRKFEMLLGQRHDFDEFDHDLIKRYVCMGDDFADSNEDGQGQFADLTRSADLHMECPSIPVPLCIRDTPGVNDTFMMREQITIRAIRDSQLCVLVLSAHQALTSTDLGLVRLISNVKSRELIIFVNRIDELQDPENQLPEIRKSIQATLDKHNGPKNVEIIMGCAMWASLTLSDQMNDISKDSLKTLTKCVEIAVAQGTKFDSIEELVWELSGLPYLSACISERIKQSTYTKALAAVRTKARNLVTSLNTSENLISMRLNGKTLNVMGPLEIEKLMAKIESDLMNALDQRLDRIFDSFSNRVEQSNKRFVDRALESLLCHLELYGDHEVWQYSPDGLRMLLRSGYQFMRTQYRKECDRTYQEVADRIAQAYREALMIDVDNFKIDPPSAPTVPAPIAIGKTIALDLQSNWWKGWWRRKRGFRAYSESFHKLLMDETEVIISDLKVTQTDSLREQARQHLRDFLDDQAAALLDVSNKASISIPDLNKLFGIAEQERRRELLEMFFEELQPDFENILLEGEAA